MNHEIASSPHRRYNPLLDEWVLVSPHRSQRPWSGKVEAAQAGNRPAYDPTCYLCPRNTRAKGLDNPDYQSTYVFENDFAALLKTKPGQADVIECNGLIQAAPERGICRVICFSPRHDLTVAEMNEQAIAGVVNEWNEQYEDLRHVDFISHVLIFENKGEVMGCSNPHPHGQIWANESIPYFPAKKIDSQRQYFTSHSSPMLMDYLAWELSQGERIIQQNDHFVSLVPFWAVWPFEAMIVPKREVQCIGDLSDDERLAWAAILKDLAVRFDNIFECSFPYSMGINQRPTDGQEYPGLVMHQSFYPPLLRNALVKKFQVGYEMSGESQRDITQEQAASRLRECSPTHFRCR